MPPLFASKSPFFVPVRQKFSHPVHGLPHFPLLQAALLFAEMFCRTGASSLCCCTSVLCFADEKSFPQKCGIQSVKGRPLSPPGFQHVEKIGSFYGMYSPLLWKTFRTGKTAGPGRDGRRSSKGQFCKTGPGRRQAVKKSGRADKKAAICWQTRSAYAILYLGLSSDKIVGLAACASGAARPGEHALHRSDRNGRRT